MSAGVWLPATESVLNSADPPDPATRTYWFLHPFSAIEFFLPFPLAAFPLLPEWRTALFEGREPFLGSMFLGAVLLPFCRRSRRWGGSKRRSLFVFSRALRRGYSCPWQACVRLFPGDHHPSAPADSEISQQGDDWSGDPDLRARRGGSRRDPAIPEVEAGRVACDIDPGRISARSDGFPARPLCRLFPGCARVFSDGRGVGSCPLICCFRWALSCSLRVACAGRPEEWARSSPAPRHRHFDRASNCTRISMRRSRRPSWLQA